MLSLKRTALPVLTLLCLALGQAMAGGEAKTGFLDKVYKGADGVESKYVVFVPHDYKGDKEYPCILFLHGAGETGDDGQKQVKVGIGPAIKKMEKSFQFIVVMPQSQKKTWKADSDDGKRAVAILDEVRRAYKIDGKRVYLTGLSMGGSGTWSLAAAHPDRWAAIVPLCGRCDPSTLVQIKTLPCWCFCGDKDNETLVKNNREITKALKDAGAPCRYEEYAGVGHNCWDRAYATAELYEWMLKQKSK